MWSVVVVMDVWNGSQGMRGEVDVRPSWLVSLAMRVSWKGGDGCGGGRWWQAGTSSMWVPALGAGARTNGMVRASGGGIPSGR